MRMIRATLVALAAVLAACGTSPSSPALTPMPSQVPSQEPSPTADPAQADLDRYLEGLERTHPEPFHGVPRADFVAKLEEVKAGIAERTPEETMVEVMRLVAMLSREDGRDGHQLAFPDDDDAPMLPIRVFEFADGVFITDAVDADLVGARITAVAGHPIGVVLELIEPLVPRDSPATVPGMRPFYLLRADVLQGLGLISDDASVEVTVELGGTRTVELETIAFEEYASWGGGFGLIHLPQRDGLRFTDFSRRFWTEVLDGDTLYVRLTQVAAVSRAALDDLRDQLADPALTVVVFDLRHNPGGDNSTYPPLLSLLRDAAQPMWVLTDRRTFSAAGNLATELEQSRTDIRFGGEAMGGGLNFWDDVLFATLDHLPIPMQIGVSTRYWQKSFADDPRLTIEPDLPVEYVAADYFAGRDATLEAVLSAP